MTHPSTIPYHSYAYKMAVAACKKDACQPDHWEATIREKHNNFNDVVIHCSDGESVHCQSFLLRVASDVFDEMLQVGIEEKSSDAISIEAPKFPSSVMTRVKTYCHLGELSRISKDEMAVVLTIKAEMQCMMDTIVAADYYNISGLGSKCLDYIKYLLDCRTNLAFLVASKFGLDDSGESRCVVASTMAYARHKITKFGTEQLELDSFDLAGFVQDYATLRKIVELMPCNALLKIQFLEKWVNLDKTSSDEKERVKVARELVKDTNMLQQIGKISPRLLVAKNGPLRSSTLVDSEAIMDAIYASTPLEEQG